MASFCVLQYVYQSISLHVFDLFSYVSVCFLYLNHFDVIKIFSRSLYDLIVRTMKLSANLESGIIQVHRFNMR